ncbi:diguanylate cyclase/phosphodiesterase with GAF sensor [Gulbenkiania indica]|uniref:Diguanylate cyclase/phosphodiesterase with GAF sensor n=2 Tax=Gulbenkiania indica TaxID=375574 RepID=A0A0K6GXQ8_9NEIS|nr:diguanylate cyclase/phosphodiesterase with GAF sensor [Gulbenkiania indica]
MNGAHTQADAAANNHYDKSMNSPAEHIHSLEHAARQAAEVLLAESGLASVAVWARLGSLWQRLHASGPQTDLPLPESLESGVAVATGFGALPLVAGSTRLGWLVWEGEAPACLSQVAALFCGHLEAARLYAEQTLNRLTHDTLLDINRLAGECAALEPFLAQLHQLMARMLDAPHFHMALYDEDSGQVRYPIYIDATGQETPAAEPYAVQPPGSPTVYLMRQGDMLVLGAAQLRSLAKEQGMVLPGHVPAHWMGVPLYAASGAVIGAAVTSRDGRQPFTQREQARFLFIARHIGFALDRVLYRHQVERQVWQRTAELEGVNARLRAEVAERKRAEQFQNVLYRVAELSNTSLSLEAFLAGVHRLLSELVDARNCVVALYDSAANLIHFPYCADAQARLLTPRPPGRGRIERVLHSGRALLIERGSHNPLAHEEADPAPHSWLGVPLYCGNDLLGVLAVQSYDTRTAYTYRDQEVLEYVANNIGTALARVRALEELQVAYNELEQRVRDRTSELDAANAQLEFDSQHDPLTRLPNRTFFAKTLRGAWDAFLHAHGPRFAVLFIDLDRFKLVNDTLGHLAGDHLLHEAGNRIRHCLRHGDFLARLGGDEFAVLLFDVDSLEGCEQIARRIVAEFDRPVILAGREVFTTASLGVVIADREHYRDAEELLRDADHAMYRTKQQGRHGYTLFNHELRLDQADQLALETELRRALEEDGQLVPYFQPFVDACSGRLVGFESLVRWRHPTRGLLCPALFLPIAEESGLITRLDRYMIRAASRQLATWRSEGRVDENITLHINLSSANFHDTGLVEWLETLIDEYALPPSMLHLEVTESALIDVPDTAATVMQRLQARGVRLALDDFGTGYSALSYLHRYRFDVLKIDQSFVFEVDRKEESAAIVRAILALAAALGLDVVAEGVETATQVARLTNMGCAKLQGYYFGRPAPADEIDWARLGTPERMAHA